MSKVRIHEVAKELGIKGKDVLEKAQELGLDAKTPSSAISDEEAQQLANYILTGERHFAASAPAPTPPAPSEPLAASKPSEAAAVPEPEPKPEPAKPVHKVPTSMPKPKEPETPPAVAPAMPAMPKVDVPHESLAQATLQNKRKGLVIVKKKRVDEEPVRTPEPLPTRRLTSEQQESLLRFESEAAKKKKKKKGVASKKEGIEKIDITAAIEMKESSIDTEESDVIVLPDFSVDTTEENQRKTKPSKEFTQARTVKNNNEFLNQGTIRRGKPKKRRKEERTSIGEVVTSIEIPEDIRVYEFAEKLGKQPSEVIKALFTLGVMVTKNDFLDKDAIEILADEFDIEVHTVNPQEDFDYEKEYETHESGKLETRAPVITIMGHVDHGKTSLLDAIRNARVAHGEHGGITQHVGAYMVIKNGKKITFIDTPGHEAFTEMRSRGAQVTDIVIIVVAADDGVKPQTVEAIDHAKAAGVPIIVAINKMDKPDANPDMVKAQLAERGITPTEWGGEHEFVAVSAKARTGLETLLDTILIQSELMDLRADPHADAKAVVIESTLEKGRGPVATVVVQNGTLRVGSSVVAGVAYGKVRALLDDSGKNIEAIHPGEPGVVVGLSDIPNAGEKLVKVESDKKAKEYADKRADYNRQKELSRSTKVTLDELSSMIAEGQLKTLPVIIKADVGGSLEAIKGSLEKLRNEETKIQVVHSGVGGITENDITLAGASENCVILGFHVRPTGSVKEKAKKLNVEIKTYNVIYDLIDDIKGILTGMMAPVMREEALGQAEVREVFVVPKVGAIAGCLVTDGSIVRGAKVRLIRDGVIVYEGAVSSLKRFKDDIREVAKGYECGIGIEKFNDIKVGDYIESFKEVQERPTL